MAFASRLGVAYCRHLLLGQDEAGSKCYEGSHRHICTSISCALVRVPVLDPGMCPHAVLCRGVLPGIYGGPQVRMEEYRPYAGRQPAGYNGSALSHAVLCCVMLCCHSTVLLNTCCTMLCCRYLRWPAAVHGRVPPHAGRQAVGQGRVRLREGDTNTGAAENQVHC